MAFTYDLSATGDDLNISKVRLEIGDTVEDSGVLPDGSNLADDEIQLYLDAASDNIGSAVSAISTMLSRRWAGVVDVAVGPRRESLSKVSEQWAARAQLSGSGSGVAGAYFGRVAAR